MDLLDELVYGDDGKLYAQDALLAIAVCASEVYKEYDPALVQRIASLALVNPLFKTEIETVQKRVYRLVHSITQENRDRALDLAMESLPVDSRETAFTWAAYMIARDQGLTDANKEFLDDLATQLSINRKTAAKIVKKVVAIDPLSV